MTFYEDMQGIATDLLTEFQQGEILMIKSTPGIGKPWKPGAPTERTVTVQGAARGAKLSFSPKSLVQVGDLIVTIDVPSDPADYPDMTDTLSIDGTRMKIVDITQKPAAGVPVVFTCLVRKGG